MKLKFKLLIPALLIFCLTIGFLYVSNQHQTATTIEAIVLQQARDVRNLLMATRRVYHQQFLNSELALNEKTLGFLPAHALSKISQDLPHWSDTSAAYFNNVSMSPRNKTNQANPWQQDAIEYFANHPQAKERMVSLPSKTGDQHSYHYSTPIYIESYCLKCHGEKKNTPAIIQHHYSGGFDLQDGQLHGILSIRLPADKLFAAMERSQIINLIILMLGAASGGFVLIVLFRSSVAPRLNELWTISQRHRYNNDDLNGERQQQKNFKYDDFDKVITNFNLMSQEIEQREAELIASNEFSTTILNNISDAVAVIDPIDRTITAVNPAFLRLHNISHSDAVGTLCSEAFSCSPLEDDEDKTCLGKNSLDKKVTCRAERRSTIDGTDVFCDVCSTPVINRQGEVTQLIRVARNITAAKKQQQRVLHLAYHDSLTGLPNRALFNDRLEQALRQSTRENMSGVIAFIDLDKFKQINDTFGHAVGDKLLKTTADRLAACVRQTDTVARMSGDEFLIIFHKVATTEHACNLAKQILDTLSQPITIGTQQINTSASVGLCFFPKHGSSVDELLSCADHAMYKAKENNGNNFYIHQ